MLKSVNNKGGGDEMTITDFNNARHGANQFAMYDGKKYYVISVDFRESLFALVNDDEHTPPDEWMWCRCENVDLI